MVKTCTKCNEEKPLEGFSKGARAKDGLQSKCKACNAAQGKSYRKANGRKIYARNKAYREANSERVAAYDKAYRKANSEKIAAKNRAYREANPEKKAAQVKAYREANPEKVAAKNKAWREAHPYEVLASAAKSRATKHNALPIWYSKDHHDQIIGIYEERDRITAATGVTHEVDHILPINGDTVSGFHVPENLQIITKTENMQKGNTHDFS